MPQTNQCVADGNLPPDIYTANLATTLTYAINFEYIAEADVVVYREQPAGTYTLLTNSATAGANNYTINEGVDPSLVTFTTAPGGQSLIIGRRTDICDPLVEYQVGASIRAQDMNLTTEQLLFLIQETRSILGFMVNGNDTDPIIPGTGMDLNDLDDVDVEGSTNRSWFYYNGTEWVDGRAVMSGEDWVSNNQSVATTAAMDERFTDATADTIGLVWAQDDTNPAIWRATQFRQAAGADPVNIANTEFANQGVGGARVLVVNLAGGAFAVVATSGPWDWDQVAQNFIVTVENPVTETPITAVADLTNATRITTQIANYIQNDPDPAYASDTTSTQVFGTDADATIQSGSTDLTGGNATATVNFTLADDNPAPVTANLVCTWRDATSNLVQINLPDTLFLDTYATANLNVTIGGLSDPAANSETTLTSDQDDATFSVNDANGSFASVITFDPAINKNSDDVTVTATTTFTRPDGVAAAGGGGGGGGYTATGATTRTATTNFTFPDIWRVNNTAPTNANVINGTEFAATWNNTGIEGPTLNITPGAVTAPNTLWAGFRTAGGVPTSIQIIIDGIPRDIAAFDTTTVDLSPNGAGQPPAGYVAEEYTFLSFPWNQTTATEVRYR